METQIHNAVEVSCKCTQSQYTMVSIYTTQIPAYLFKLLACIRVYMKYQ